MVFVPNGQCESAVELAPVVGRTYLLQYDYRANHTCGIQCVEQTAAPDGTFTNSPCPTPPAKR